MSQIILLTHGISIDRVNYPNNSLTCTIIDENIQINLKSNGRLVLFRHYTDYTNSSSERYNTPQEVIDELLLNNVPSGGGGGTWGSITGTLSDQTDLQAALDSEQTAREDADDELAQDIIDEATSRSSADSTLQNNIDSEETARQNADNTLQTNINNEATARANADTTLQSNINNEEAARISADSALDARTTNLENEELKILYFATISATSGTITKPTNSTIILNDFPAGVDAIIETLVNGEPSGLSAYTSAGVPITVSSFDTSGNYILSGTPTDFPGNVVLLYVLKIKMIDYGNLTLDNIIESQSAIDISTQNIGNLINGATSKTTPADNDSFGLSDSAANNILKKFTWGNFKSAIGLTNLKTGQITFIIDGNGSVALVGTMARATASCNGTITGWEVVEASNTPVSSTCVIDIWKDTYANYPPTVADSIAGSEKPSLSTQTKNQDLTLTSFSPDFSIGDEFTAYLESNTSGIKYRVTLFYNRT